MRKAKQGWARFGVEMKIVDDVNRELPRDGKRFGRLKVAGFAVVKSYFKGEGGQILDEDGFFDTGDVATIDPNGYMQITDRAKDVMKSGGEWISSIDIENLAVGRPEVAEAVVIGVHHPEWDERPLLVVAPEEGKTPQAEDVLGFLQSRTAKWWKCGCTNIPTGSAPCSSDRTGSPTTTLGEPSSPQTRESLATCSEAVKDKPCRIVGPGRACALP
jgi:fatty-acyl-CoA synthase